MSDFWRLQRFSSLGSTSDLCKELAAQGAPAGTAITALEQTAGRGRQGRFFASPKGFGLYLSVLLRPQVPPEQAAQLTAWTAVTLREVLQGVCGVTADIKWPNDLLLGGKKLCGILTEFVPPDGVIIGMGINLNQTAEDFGDLSPIATSLGLETGDEPDLEEVLQGVLRGLREMAEGFPGDKNRVLAAYRAGCVTLRQPVFLLRPAERVSAFAEDVDEGFRLRVVCADGSRETVSSGEVSLRHRL
ncbi:MAG: biotin--[acetyl-CoA-carboxylase] ligase [Pseudoflavonifractor sp.]